MQKYTSKGEMESTPTNSRWLYLVPILIGIITFYLLAGFKILNPSYTAWIPTGDPTINFISWDFYRYSTWNLPVGLNPTYGGSVSSSIVYSDLIPIAAIALKSFSKYLSEPFQYLGLWHFLCFLCQALISWKLIEIFCQDTKLKIIGTLLFLFAPPFTTLLNITAALQSHFLILGSLYLIFSTNINNNARLFAWIFLLITAVSIQFYLFAMVAGLWIADNLNDFFSNKTKAMPKTLFRVIGTITLVILSAWQIGYFEVSGKDASASGYGDTSNKFNPLSVFLDTELSYIESVIPPIVRHADASLNFLGFGMIVGLFFVMVNFKKSKFSFFASFKKYKFLLIILVIYFFIAITNKVTIGNLSFEIPLNDNLLNLVGILRSSSRMFWPIFYILYLAIIYFIIKSYPKKLATYILGLILIIQVIDTSIWWIPMRNQITHPQSSPFDNRLISPFWDSAPKIYKTILRVPTLKYEMSWEIFGKYAAKHRMNTNIVMLNRPNLKKINSANINLDTAIKQGEYQTDTIYIVDDDLVTPILLNLDRNKHLFAKIDGFNVLAPSYWLNCQECPIIPLDSIISKYIPIPKIDEPILFSKNSNGPNYLIGIGRQQEIGYGWSYPEAWGVWSEGREATLTIPFPLSSAPKKLVLVLKSISRQKIIISTYGTSTTTAIIEPGQEVTIDLNLEHSDLRNYVNIKIQVETPKSAKELGIGEDIRTLGIGLISATFH